MDQDYIQNSVEMIDLLNNSYFRFAVILLIIYMSNKDLQTALMITIAFFLVMSLSNSCHCHNVLRKNLVLTKFQRHETIR